MDCTLYRDGEKLNNLGLCSVLTAENDLVYRVSSEGPPCIVAIYDKPGLTEDNYKNESTKAPDVYVCK